MSVCRFKAPNTHTFLQLHLVDFDFEQFVLELPVEHEPVTALHLFTLCVCIGSSATTHHSRAGPPPFAPKQAISPTGTLPALPTIQECVLNYL